VDRLVAIDGSYEGFSDHPESRDGTLTLIMGFQKPRILQKAPPAPFKSEVHKRNQYLFDNYIRPGDWMLMIDADEYITTGISETHDFLQASKEPYHSVCIFKPGSMFRRADEWVRLIRYESGMRYVGNHFTIQYADGHIMPMKAKPAPLVICHDHTYVPKTYRDAMERYNDLIRPKVEK
jgi:hypothetical protein